MQIYSREDPKFDAVEKGFLTSPARLDLTRTSPPDTWKLRDPRPRLLALMVAAGRPLVRHSLAPNGPERYTVELSGAGRHWNGGQARLSASTSA